MSGTPPATRGTCPGCGTEVLIATDYVTEEAVLLDVTPVQGGRVEVLRPPLPRQRLVAHDYITRPAPRQPARELHARTCTNPAAPVPVDLSDDPVREQSGGWRR